MVHDPRLPESWLRFAESDLEFAKVKRTSKMMIEKQMFHAQQAVEKSIKAVMVLKRIEPPKMHNINGLLEILRNEIEIPAEVDAANYLGIYAAVLRYPGLYEDSTENMLRDAVKHAENVLEWAKSVIGIR